jgi:hypothetical protein
MHRLESELRRGLASVTAPPELWDRVQAARFTPSNDRPRGLVWAMAATVVVVAVGLSLVNRENVAVAGDSQKIAFHCQNPAELRAWVKATTGLDVPLRAAPVSSIQFIGARNTGDRAEIAYRAGNRDGLLLVSRADGAADVPHNHASGNVSSWVMAGQRFTVASDNPGDLQLACKLCHLD